MPGKLAKVRYTVYAIKFLNLRTPENLVVIYLKCNIRGQTSGYFVKKDANGMAISEEPDQTAPLGAV